MACCECQQRAGGRPVAALPACVAVATLLQHARLLLLAVTQVEVEAYLRREGPSLVVDARQLGAVLRLSEV